MKVKVCGNRERETTKALAELPLDYLGFIFVKESPRFLTVDEARGLSVGEVKKVGVFRNSELEEVLATVSQLNLTAVQLHGAEGVPYLTKLREQLPSSVEIWKAAGVSSSEDLRGLNEMEPLVDLFVFDTKGEGGESGGTGRKFSWEILTQYKGNTPYLLAGGIGSEDGERVIEHYSANPLCIGVDINSCFEVEPGKKDLSLVKSFVQTIKGESLLKV